MTTYVDVVVVNERGTKNENYVLLHPIMGQKKGGHDELHLDRDALIDCLLAFEDCNNVMYGLSLIRMAIMTMIRDI